MASDHSPERSQATDSSVTNVPPMMIAASTSQADPSYDQTQTSSLKMPLTRFNFIKDNRKHLRSKITRIYNSLDVDELDLEECVDRLETLSIDSNRLVAYNSDISNGIWQHETRREHLDKELETCDHYSDIIRKITKALTKRKQELEGQLPLTSQPLLNGNVPNVRPSSAPISNQIKLPQLPMPEYSNAEGENLLTFLANFEGVLSKYSLSEFEKYVFLTRQLKGSPLILVKSLSQDRQSYTEAKDLLTRAFAAADSQKSEIIRRLSKLNLPQNGNYYEFISEMRSIVNSVDTLKIDVNDIIQYFIWQGLTPELKKGLISITNKNYPSLDEIMQHIFDAVNRVQSVPQTTKSYVKDSVFAASVGSNPSKTNHVDHHKSKGCILCKDTNSFHYISKCDNFSTPQTKVDKLKSLNLCTKCTRNHGSSSCNFRFHRQCYKCKGKHFSFLCLSPERQNSNDNSLSNSANTVNFSSTVLDEKIILPTFCFQLGNKKMRCLKDSGSQSSYIQADLAHKLKLKVLVPGVSLSLTGMNATKKVNTEVVEVEVPIPGQNKVHKVEAFTIKKVPTNLKLPGLQKAVDQFIKKGYQLADEYLLNNNDEITNDNSIDKSDVLIKVMNNHIPLSSYILFLKLLQLTLSRIVPSNALAL